MIYLDNHPKNSDTFVILALNGQTFGYNQKTDMHTDIVDTLQEAWALIDDPKTVWRPMPKRQ